MQYHFQSTSFPDTPRDTPASIPLGLGSASLDDDDSPAEHSPELIQRSRKGVRQGSCWRELDASSGTGDEWPGRSFDGFDAGMLGSLLTMLGSTLCAICWLVCGRVDLKADDFAVIVPGFEGPAAGA